MEYWFFLLLVLFMAWICYEWIEHTWIKHNSTVVETKAMQENEAVKVCFFADLHNNKKNSKSIAKRMQQFAPDAIVVAGDMVNKRKRDNRNAVEFLNELANIAPVFCSLGNHEESMRLYRHEAWNRFCQELSYEIHILDNETVRIEAASVSSAAIMVSGLSLPEIFYKKGRLWIKKEDFPELRKKPSGAYHILLAHHPEYAEYYEPYEPDLILSGHLHGGLARLPLVGGLISPRFRFPKQDAGFYRYPFGDLFVSRGLGSHTVPLRLFNRVELHYITIQGTSPVTERR